MKQIIQPAELQKRIDSGERVQIVDVRSAFEFASGHIPGAVNVPLSHIESTIAGVDRHEPLVLVCHSGARSLDACQRVAESHPGALNLVGGTSAWRASGLELEHGPRPPRSLDRQTHLVAALLLLAAIVLYRYAGPSWIYLALLPAFGLMLDALTGICPMTLILGKMPWNAASRPVYCTSMRDGPAQQYQERGLNR